MDGKGGIRFTFRDVGMCHAGCIHPGTGRQRSGPCHRSGVATGPGLGIDEDTAIVVKGEMFKVIGSGAVEADPDPDHWCHAVEMRSAEHASVHDIDAGAKTRGVLMNRCPA